MSGILLEEYRGDEGIRLVVGWSSQSWLGWSELSVLAGVLCWDCELGCFRKLYT